jgi:prevent-host-death family protein
MSTKPSVARTIPAGQFKARCLQIMDQVAATGQPVTVTKRGRPVVRVTPVGKRPADLFGALRGTLEITGDIVAPTDVTWDAER